MAERHRFEIRPQRGGKYAIVVLDPDHGECAVVRGMPTVAGARTLLNAWWPHVVWESDTRGSFEEVAV